MDNQKKELKENIEKHQQNELLNIEIIAIVLALSLFVNIFSNALYDYYKSSVTIGTNVAIILTTISGYYLLKMFRDTTDKYKPKKPTFYCNYDLNQLILDEQDADLISIKSFMDMSVDQETFEPLITDIFNEFVSHDVKLFGHSILKQLELTDSEIYEIGFVCNYIGNMSGIHFSFEIHMLGKFSIFSRLRKLENIECGLRAEMDTPDLPNADEIVEKIDDWFRFFVHV